MRAFMMTSSPCELGVPGMLSKNGQIDLLRSLFPKEFSMLYIVSSPSDYDKNDLYSGQIRETFEEKGFRFSRFTVLDDRNRDQAAALIAESDMLFLAGGHVPTQNRFFQEIKLKSLLQDYAGVVMSLSAGSMNAAKSVYAVPEEPGEAVDPAYRRDLEGLGLTDVNIEPHFQIMKNEQVDGLREVEDILIPDSFGREIWCFPDGTYLLSRDGEQVIYGQCDLIKNGVITRVCEDGQSFSVPKEAEPFSFSDTAFLKDDVLHLQLVRTSQPNKAACWVPAYYFAITLNDGTPIGYCDLRIGHSSRLYIGGNIGYGIDEVYRGHHYAARAVKLLRQLAHFHGLTYFYITCRPDNIASARTCVAAGGRFIEVADVPHDHDLYTEERTETVNVYRFEC